MSNKSPLDAESAQGANYTEAFNQLLRAVHCPTNLHPFLRTLIGFADGRVEVSVFDAELGQRHKAGRSGDAAAKWIQRYRKQLNDWQDANNIYLVETQKGFINKDGKHIPSRYYIHLTEYINSVLEEAKKDQRRWNTIPHVAIEFAAQKCVRNIFTSRRVYGPPKAKTTDIDKSISQNLRSCVTAIEKVSDLMEQKTDMATTEHRELWQELKGVISSYNFYFEEEDEEEEDYSEDEDDDDEGSAINEPPYDTE